MKTERAPCMCIRKIPRINREEYLQLLNFGRADWWATIFGGGGIVLARPIKSVLQMSSQNNAKSELDLDCKESMQNLCVSDDSSTAFEPCQTSIFPSREVIFTDKC